MKKGFTLIELLVVLGVLTMLSAILIQYSRTGERQLILFREQSKLIAVLSRAKALAVNTFNRPDVPCGYGIYFAPPRSYILFRDSAPNCASSDRVYSGSGEDETVYELDSQTQFKSLLVSDILFIPPDPRVVMTPTQTETDITIETIDGIASMIVRVNSAGQIGAQ
ncbi:MAG: prepilin-type N-terminal cleavage/methylation domain-containing protein [bacterium]|nr:prepilin-type N-terminal cleavage/methylation domain-containing protein [bacterium]